MLDHDQGDEEEAGDMNDDEVNEVLQRSAEELEIFRNMDIEREREADRAWFSAGNVGPRPPSLMTIEELPPQYQRDLTFDPQAEYLEVINTGGGHRRRKEVSYNDGLSDEAWTAAVDAGEDPSEIAAARRAKRSGGIDYPDDDSDEESPDGRGRKKGKGRSKKDEYDIGPSNGKRKRGGGKSMSVTPSYIEDDDDIRDNVCLYRYHFFQCPLTIDL